MSDPTMRHRPSGRSPSPWLRLAAVIGFSSCGSEEPEPAPSRPAAGAEHDIHNVLLISVDTLRPDRLSCYGGPRPTSPTIDALAQGGVRFAEAMAPIPQTSPSHASLFTGQYPLRHGLTTNNNRMRPEPVTLAEILGDHGFATGAFFHLYHFAEARVAQGFETTFRDDGPRAEALATQVDRFLEQRPDEPKFVFVHYYLPHAPLDPPADLAERFVETAYDGPLDQSFRVLHGLQKGLLQAPEEYFAHYRDQYDAEVAHTDRRLAEVLEAFRRRGELDRTLVVFTADHGERLEDGIVGLHAPYLTETTLQIPLILSGPGLPSGTVAEELVELVDVFSTVLELLDVPVPGAIDGRSLRPLMEGAAEDWEELAFAMLPSEYMGRAVPGMATLPAAMAVRDDRYLLVRDATGQVELRDLQQPPASRSLPPEAHPAEVARLGAALTDWLQRVPAGLSGEEVDEDTRRLLRELGYEIDGGP